MLPNMHVEVTLLGRLEGTERTAEGLLPRVPAVVHPELGLAVSYVVTLRLWAVPETSWPLLSLHGCHPPATKAADTSCPLLKEQ